MEDLRKMSYNALLTLLAQQTMIYTQLLTGNIKTSEFYACKELLEELTTEIEFRKKANSVLLDDAYSATVQVD
jgi:hypothetical protein